MVAVPLVDRRLQRHVNQPPDGWFFIEGGKYRHLVVIIQYVDGCNLAPYIEQVLAGSGQRVGIGFI